MGAKARFYGTLLENFRGRKDKAHPQPFGGRLRILLSAPNGLKNIVGFGVELIGFIEFLVAAVSGSPSHGFPLFLPLGGVLELFVPLAVIGEGVFDGLQSRAGLAIWGQDLGFQD